MKFSRIIRLSLTLRALSRRQVTTALWFFPVPRPPLPGRNHYWAAGSLPPITAGSEMRDSPRWLDGEWFPLSSYLEWKMSCLLSKWLDLHTWEANYGMPTWNASSHLNSIRRQSTAQEISDSEISSKCSSWTAWMRLFHELDSLCAVSDKAL